MPTMDPKRCPAPVLHNSPVNPITPSSAYIANIKAGIEDIQRRRDKASAAMSDRLYASIVEYKRADQSFVDEHTACLDELWALFPDEASTLDWAKPCIGVPEREYFAQGGIAIKYHPSSDRYGLGHQSRTRTRSRSPSAQPSFLSLPAPSQTLRGAISTVASPPSSTLSSAPSSPELLLDLGLPTSRLTSHNKPTLPLLPRKRSAAATSSSSSTSSSDELASDTQPPQPKPKKRPRPVLRAPSTGTGTGRKPLPTSRRGPTTAHHTTQQPPSTATQNIPPSLKKSYQSQVRCVECAKRRQKCDRELPCSICVRRGRGERCRYPQQQSER